MLPHVSVAADDARDDRLVDIDLCDSDPLPIRLSAAAPAADVSNISSNSISSTRNCLSAPATSPVNNNYSLYIIITLLPRPNLILQTDWLNWRAK